MPHRHTKEYGYQNPARLSSAVRVAFDKMKKYRKARLKMMQQYTGRFYTDRGMDLPDGKAFPINLIYQAATTLVPNLAYNDPKVRVSTQYMAYRPYADLLELATNHLIEEINMRDTLRKIILDAIFLAGFAKCGLGIGGQTLDLDGELHDLGQPYLDRVDADDMAIDPLARDLEEAMFIGNRFRITKQALRESGLISDEKIDQLHSRYDYTDDAEATKLSLREQDIHEYDEISEMVDLMEIWLPKENLMLTLPYDRNGRPTGDPLREVEWAGPEGGPYSMLGFAFVPDNIMPVAPCAIWYDLHILANRIARKISRQAERQKTVLAYEASAWEDTNDIVEADDGEAIRVDNVEAIKEVSFGGANDTGYEFMEWAKLNFSEMAMNLDLLSGARSETDTATQAEMLQANSSIRLADMQQLVYQFAAKASKQLAFYLHTDPLIEMPLVKRVHGVDTQAFYTPEMREGDWTDYSMKIVPYSMARQDPNVKVRRLMEFAGSVIPALANAMMSLGPAFNIESAINIIGREMGIAELDEIINSQELHQMLDRARQMIEAGVPMNQKTMQMLMNPGGQEGAGVMPMGGGVPQGVSGTQNPGAMVGMGVTPDTERNMMRHETEGELQRTY